MATNILSIGQSALAAAQVGISTTGNNIANASTPGYSRQVVIQSAAPAQNLGFGFLGQGVNVTSVQRVYNDFLGIQTQNAQSSSSALGTYYTQIQQIDNMLADSSSGLSPALQKFFSAIQDVASNPTLIPARQTALSSGDTLAANFNSMAGQLSDMAQGVNSQIQSSISSINAYAQQIAQLNDAISKAQLSTGQPPNDLLDQRDQLVLNLNKEIKATVVKQGDGSYNVFVGNGQPMVVGATASSLTTITSATNPQQIDVGYKSSNGSVSRVGDSTLTGGNLGGLIDFRANSLAPAQNALGRIAIGLASSFNAQHQAGFDLSGAAGGTFFNVASPVVGANTGNTGSGVVSASITNASALTTSDYTLRYDGTNYTLIRQSDSSVTTFASLPQTIDGVNISLSSGTPAAGDSFLIQPTVNGASGISMAITDPTKFAAAGQAGAVGDNSNALLLAGLQTAKTLGNGTASFQDAYAQFVGDVGNKTEELSVTSTAAGNLLKEATTSQQSLSGVNLDEEATNLLRYQQAYQAAGKLMQIASQLFSTLLAIGQ